MLCLGIRPHRNIWELLRQAVHPLLLLLRLGSCWPPLPPPVCLEPPLPPVCSEPPGAGWGPAIDSSRGSSLIILAGGRAPGRPLSLDFKDVAAFHSVARASQ